MCTEFGHKNWIRTFGRHRRTGKNCFKMDLVERSCEREERICLAEIRNHWMAAVQMGIKHPTP